MKRREEIKKEYVRRSERKKEKKKYQLAMSFDSYMTAPEQMKHFFFLSSML